MSALKIAVRLLLLTLSFPAAADLRVDGTRLIHGDTKASSVVRIRNGGDAPALIQSWIDTGDSKATPQELRSPLVVTTPLFRLDPNARRDIHIRAADTSGLPQDRESLLWLNILDIPARAQEGQRPAIEYAARWRLKVFHRPVGLPGKPAEAVKSLQWQIEADEGKGVLLRARNPSAYHVSLRTLTLEGRPVPLAAAQAQIPPYGEWTVALDSDAHLLRDGLSLTIKWIDDEGVFHPWNAKAVSSK